MKNPKASVIMPVYNEEKYIKKAIESILNQTFKDFEFIIIDDGSTDRTKEILKKYKDKRIKIITNRKNEFVSRALNKGIKKAKGEYIIRIDGDDIALPNRLEKQINFLETHPEISVLGSAIFEINKKNSLKLMPVLTKDDQIKKGLGLRMFRIIYHPTVIIRKKVLIDIGMYNEKLQYTQDKDLWLRLAAKEYKFENLREPLLFKLEKKNSWFLKARSGKRKKDREKVYFLNKNNINYLKQKYKSIDLPLLPDKSFDRSAREKYARIYFDSGKKLCNLDLCLSRKAFLMAIRYSPCFKEAYFYLFKTYLNSKNKNKI